ncbi:MAG: hypothetical protein ABL872_03055 [Lacibacter sp.]
MKTIYAFLFLFIISCNSSTPADKPVTLEKIPTETISAIVFNYDLEQLTVTFVSNGCTVKEDFIFEQNNSMLTIVRKKKDECKAVPQAITISWTFKEAGIDPNRTYNIQNGFAANPFSANTTTNEK